MLFHILCIHPILFLTGFWPCRGFWQNSLLPSLSSLTFSWLLWHLSVFLPFSWLHYFNLIWQLLLLHHLTPNAGISAMKSIQPMDEWKRPWWKDQCSPQCHRQGSDNQQTPEGTKVWPKNFLSYQFALQHTDILKPAKVHLHWWLNSFSSPSLLWGDRTCVGMGKGKWSHSVVSNSLQPHGL